MSFPDPASATNAVTSGEMDRWKNPTGDLMPLLKLSRECSVAIKDPTGSARWNASLLRPCNRRRGAVS